ncbi:hypothetical protein NMY3_00313 [Candidatus Nitrosocosmicus oleophilus]|uniref:Uncharacterized protein n=1 Tax=Candidatus Nitrosocosmicus oleophilus TaxID=1353260 RepID=A0A654LU50_9ARCH|nr:hypothetical protein NMY3_00313 [Candidatus Nitrosocosmicus oleophilus]
MLYENLVVVIDLSPFVLESHYHWELNPHAPKLNDILLSNDVIIIRIKPLQTLAPN